MPALRVPPSDCPRWASAEREKIYVGKSREAGVHASFLKIMNTWTPLWSQVVESTLWEEPLEVRVLFLTMLAIKDPDHVVRMPFRRLCKKANMDPPVVQGALETLMKPDHRSPEPQEFEGRRVEAVEGGWLILNGEHYRQEMAKLMRRFYKASWARDKRARSRSHKPLPGEAAAVAAEERGDQNGADAITSAALPQGKTLCQVFAEEEAATVPRGTFHPPESGPESLQPPANSAADTPAPPSTTSLPAPESEEDDTLYPDGSPPD